MIKKLPVYLDNQATTRLDPEVFRTMRPFFEEEYGNPGSVSHAIGWRARRTVDQARKQIAGLLGAKEKEILFTSGATESNNLAIRGVVQRNQDKGRHLVSVVTEHPSVLAPLERLKHAGYEVTLLPVEPSPSATAGRIHLDQLADAIRDDTVLVSVMAANHEIGTLQPLREIGRLCKERGVLFHTDATQAVGKIPIDVRALGIDLMSFSGHKIYGPKGVGGLFIRRSQPIVRIEPQIDGGNQETGLRSGTLNVPGIVGLAAAMQLCVDQMEAESERLTRLRGKLFQRLSDGIEGLRLNGPAIDQQGLRLPGNLNVTVPGIEGESLLMSMKELALSSGSACSSERPEPSHVLRAIGLDAAAAKSSLRIGIGRFNTEEEIDFAAETIVETVERLRKLYFR